MFVLAGFLLSALPGTCADDDDHLQRGRALMRASDFAAAAAAFDAHIEKGGEDRDEARYLKAVVSECSVLPLGVSAVSPAQPFVFPP